MPGRVVRNTSGVVGRHDARGWWLDDAGPVEPEPPLEGDVRADVVVVGGGFTGLWTAWEVLAAEPEASVVLLEADEHCGAGPSGRNGGFANCLWFSLPGMRDRFGDARAIEVARESQAAVDAIGEFCEAEGVDAHFRQSGYMQVATTPVHDGAWERPLEALAELGEPQAARELTPAEVAERCASPVFRGGALYPGAATVHPARLALGLRRRLIDRGVRIFERTPVLEVRSGSDGVKVITPLGSVAAGRASLGAGGRLAAFGPTSRRLTLTSSHMVITEPVPDVLDELGWRGGECITDSRAMVHYFRTTEDDRIAFGWGGGKVVPGARTNGSTELDPPLVEEVAEHLVRFFPMLEGRRIDHGWGGPIDVSPSHIPVVLPVDERVAAGFGYTGNGVGPSRLIGRVLASLALDRRDAFSRLALIDPKPPAVPPEPFRFIGGSIIRAALLRSETAQEGGLQPDPLTALVAGVPERIGIHVGR
ncbi:FAD-dependent oxidoreductase [Thermoleophilia bacterium SCSIO 60948]|nr:FAD-dependent oxidoreductase [Thermoleophilia bacterium SCSIO 60948]